MRAHTVRAENSDVAPCRARHRRRGAPCVRTRDTASARIAPHGAPPRAAATPQRATARASAWWRWRRPTAAARSSKGLATGGRLRSLSVAVQCHRGWAATLPRQWVERADRRNEPWANRYWLGDGSRLGDGHRLGIGWANGIGWAMDTVAGHRRWVCTQRGTRGCAGCNACCGLTCSAGGANRPTLSSQRVSRGSFAGRRGAACRYLALEIAKGRSDGWSESC